MEQHLQSGENLVFWIVIEGIEMSFTAEMYSHMKQNIKILLQISSNMSPKA